MEDKQEIAKNKMSNFYQKKSKTEIEQAFFEEIINCEKALSSENFAIIGEKCVSSSKLDTCSISVRIFPEASDRLHTNILRAIKEYKEEIEILKDEIEGKKVNTVKKVPYVI